MRDERPLWEATVPTAPAAMRQAVAGYVEAVHAAYLDHARSLAPALRARLPLVAAGTFRVAAVAGRELHLVATEEPLAGAAREGATTPGQVGPLRWTLCFYDPSVLPGLGDPVLTQYDVRRLLGIATTMYHLVVPVGSTLEAHRAAHTGVGLAAAHAAEASALEALRTAFPDRLRLVDELIGAARAGLTRAEALLAHQLLPTDEALSRLASEDDPDPAAVRGALVAACRRVSHQR